MEVQEEAAKPVQASTILAPEVALQIDKWAEPAASKFSSARLGPGAERESLEVAELRNVCRIRGALACVSGIEATSVSVSDRPRKKDS